MSAVTREQVLEALADLARFDTIIDARSESEYAEDHIPGAISCPVLNNEERAALRQPAPVVSITGEGEPPSPASVPGGRVRG